MIKYFPQTNTFHLYNEQISYVLTVLKNGHLGHLYFGEKVSEHVQPEWFRYALFRPLTACVYEDDPFFSLEHERLEYPNFGTTDFREPAFRIRQENGSAVSDFKYITHRIVEGKPMPKGLPASYVSKSSEAQTLEIDMIDSVADLKLTLYYTIFSDLAVVTRRVEIVNEGQQIQTIEKAMSMSVDLSPGTYERVHLWGAWSRERHLERTPLSKGVQSIGSTRGCSSPDHNPFIAIAEPSATEHSGAVYGFSLIYSGNFIASTQVNYDNVPRVMMGIHPNGFEWVLGAGERFQTPEAVMTYSSMGLNGMSQAFHKLVKNHLTRGEWVKNPRPILLNNWEATYFDFTEDKIVELATEAKRLGVELFVLDDGWFGKRNDDTSSLGDWFVNLDKLPNGIKGLSKRVSELGIRFGLWFEPEMINKVSQLYEKHPEWLIGDPSRHLSNGRNQYVLDFTRKEVVDHIFKSMCQVIDNTEISYIKWDMNRHITEAYSTALPANQQGELYHRYILGVYDLYDRLIERYPHILFESCASGGGRFDLGMFYYAPQAWTSDDTDAIERLKIQYGSSMLYPLSAMGSHVSAVPNHQVNRATSLKTRAEVAYFGTFGYELDVTKMSDEDKLEMQSQIEFFKEHRNLIHHGEFSRLTGPFDGDSNRTAWMVVNAQKTEALLGLYKVMAEPNTGVKSFKLRGLDPNRMYDVTGYDTPVSGRVLMNYGILDIPSFTGAHLIEDRPVGDYQSHVIKIKAVD